MALEANQIVTWKRLRDRLMQGANNPQGARLTVYESHYALQLADMLATQASHQFQRITSALDLLDEARREDDTLLAARDARAEKD